MRAALAVIFAAGVYAGAAAPSLINIGAASSPPAFPLPACTEEDDENCFWDAQTMGNGEGMSFVDINGTLFLLDLARARACRLAKEAPTDANIEACTGQPIEMPAPIPERDA